MSFELGNPVAIWWEDTTFCVQFEDDTIVKYYDAYISNYEPFFEVEDPENLSIEEINVSVENVIPFTLVK